MLGLSYQPTQHTKAHNLKQKYTQPTPSAARNQSGLLWKIVWQAKFSFAIGLRSIQQPKIDYYLTIQSADLVIWSQRSYNLQNRPCSLKTIQFAGQNACSLQTVDHTSCTPNIMQTICRTYSLQTIWFVSSFLHAISLGISSHSQKKPP